MKKVKAAQFLAALFFAVSNAGAQGFNLDSLSARDIASTEAPVPQAPAAPEAAKEVKEWTIMAFMNGKNNLADYIGKDMNEMEVVGPVGSMNIVVEAGKIAYSPPSWGGWDDYSDYPDYTGGWGGIGGIHPWQTGGLPPYMDKSGRSRGATTSWTGTRRYEIVKDTDTYELGSKLIEDMGKVDMGDYKSLVEFVKWAKQAYPAKKYMLIVWNHGDGWKAKNAKGPAVTKGISYDDETGNGISMIQLGQALREIGGVDIYASDACLMQMAEVVNELGPYAPVIVGSEETEPGDGWAYDYFLSRIKPNKLTTSAIAAAAVQGYTAYYKEKGKGTTQSAVRSSGIARVKALVDEWTALAMNSDRAKVLEAANASLGFEGVDARDLVDFVVKAGEKTGDAAMQAKAAEIAAAVDAMVFSEGKTGDAYQASNGLAVYIPTYGFSAAYEANDWARTSNWDEFLKWMLERPAAN